MEWTAVAVALIAAAPPMAAVLVGLRKINSRLGDGDSGIERSLINIFKWQELHSLEHEIERQLRANTPCDPRHPGQAGGSD